MWMTSWRKKPDVLKNRYAVFTIFTVNEWLLHDIKNVGYLWETFIICNLIFYSQRRFTQFNCFSFVFDIFKRRICSFECDFFTAFLYRLKSKSLVKIMDAITIKLKKMLLSRNVVLQVTIRALKQPRSEVICFFFFLIFYARRINLIFFISVLHSNF